MAQEERCERHATLGEARGTNGRPMGRGLWSRKHDSKSNQELWGHTRLIEQGTEERVAVVGQGRPLREHLAVRGKPGYRDKRTGTGRSSGNLGRWGCRWRATSGGCSPGQPFVAVCDMKWDVGTVVGPSTAAASTNQRREGGGREPVRRKIGGWPSSRGARMGGVSALEVAACALVLSRGPMALKVEKLERVASGGWRGEAGRQCRTVRIAKSAN